MIIYRNCLNWVSGKNEYSKRVTVINKYFKTTAENNGVKTSNVTQLIEYLKSVDCKVFFAHNSTLIEERLNVKHMEHIFAPLVERM